MPIACLAARALPGPCKSTPPGYIRFPVRGKFLLVDRLPLSPPWFREAWLIRTIPCSFLLRFSPKQKRKADRRIEKRSAPLREGAGAVPEFLPGPALQ